MTLAWFKSIGAERSINCRRQPEVFPPLLSRVLLQQNKVLILDEPTAHVDPSTERTIQTTVLNQLRECTVITVAHRLSTIRDCDKILVMEDGSAVEFDSYDQLMRKENGVFADIANKQC